MFLFLIWHSTATSTSQNDWGYLPIILRSGPTPTPTFTPSQTPVSTATGTPAQMSNLLVNPGFAEDNGECFSPTTTAQITGWNHEYFGFGGVTQNFPENQPWPSCAARTKGALHGSGQGEIPEGETALLWQVVAVPAYSQIVWKDARMEHEDGVVYHRLYGCIDLSEDSCTFMAETTSTIPQVEDKGVCDAFVQVITVDNLGGISSVEYADPEAGCPLENLPDPVSFSARFGEWPHLMVEVEIDPLPDGEGESGYKAGWWSLEVVE